MVLTFLLLLCNHDNLILKLHQKNCFLDEGWLFIGSFKVGSGSRMINKEVLAQFIKTCIIIRKMISRNIWKSYYSMYIEERGWVNAQILLTNCFYIEKS